jgi:hypothetical protein
MKRRWINQEAKQSLRVLKKYPNSWSFELWWSHIQGKNKHYKINCWSSCIVLYSLIYLKLIFQHYNIFLWRITFKIQIQWNLGSRTPLFTNKFSEQKRLGWQTVSRITNTQVGNSGGLRVWVRECQLLVNLVSVYEHFGSRTASTNELSSWTEVPLYMVYGNVGSFSSWYKMYADSCI